MTKNAGPCFEFVLNREGAKIEFTFLPGNVSKQIFEETRNALLSAFKSQYGVSSSDYIREVPLEDGTKTIAIYQSKVLPVLKVILGSRAFSDFKVRITGEDVNGEPKTKIINNPVEAKSAAEVIPYFNKRNNDMTTRRSK